MSTDEVVEEALRAYHPPKRKGGTGKLVREGKFLVMPSSGKRITLEEANAALEEVRNEER